MEFPRHTGSLSITHNEHRDNYLTVQQAIDTETIYYVREFESAEAIAECIAADSVWAVQWYPNSPVSSFKVCAPTFERALARACEVQREEDAGLAVRP